MLCDNLEGMGREGAVKREGMCVYLCLIHADIQQKPTQHCTAPGPPTKK